MFANRFTAFVDACSLASALKRNLLLSLAEAEFFRLRWSSPVLDESETAIEEILTGKGFADAAARAERARASMEAAFEDAMVTDFDNFLPVAAGLPDPNDHHVVAAAAKTEAAMIVTENLKDFPAAILSDLNMEAKSADAFIADTIALDEAPRTNGRFLAGKRPFFMSSCPLLCQLPTMPAAEVLERRGGFFLLARHLLPHLRQHRLNLQAPWPVTVLPFLMEEIQKAIDDAPPLHAVRVALHPQPVDEIIDEAYINAVMPPLLIHVIAVGLLKVLESLTLLAFGLDDIAGHHPQIRRDGHDRRQGRGSLWRFEFLERLGMVAFQPLRHDGIAIDQAHDLFPALCYRPEPILQKLAQLLRGARGNPMRHADAIAIEGQPRALLVKLPQTLKQVHVQNLPLSASDTFAFSMGDSCSGLIKQVPQAPW